MNRSAFTLTEWLSWMEASHPVAIDMGLDRCQSVYENLHLDFKGITVFTVAGTNGKGSSVAMLDAILQAAGYTTACYTSPHLSKYNERIRFNGEQSSDDQLVQAFNAVDQARGDTSLTYFEMGTLAALWLVAKNKPQVALLEVGLGGRLDVVNLVDADIAIITTIDIDHVDWLGDNREKIGWEKAGIFRSGKPAVCGDLNPPDSIANHALSLKTPLYQVNEQYRFDKRETDWTWSGLSQSGQKVEFNAISLPALPLQNAATVLQAIVLSGLEVDKAAINLGLSRARVAGRMDHFESGECSFLFDVAHNPQSAAYLAEQLKRINRDVSLVLGMLSDKDCEQVMEILHPVVSEWHFVSLDVPRGQSADDLQERLRKINMNTSSQPVFCHQSVKVAIESLVNKKRSDNLIVVAGSFYTVGDAYAALHRDVN